MNEFSVSSIFKTLMLYKESLHSEAIMKLQLNTYILRTVLKREDLKGESDGYCPQRAQRQLSSNPQFTVGIRRT